MAFTWNAFSPILLALDLGFILCTAACIAWLGRRARVSWTAPSFAGAGVLRVGFVFSLAPWAVVGMYIGGIIGLSLIARSLWTTATVTVPLLGAWLAWKWRRRWAWALILLPLGLKFYGESWEPNRLEVERVRVSLPGLRETVRVVHLSDLQTDGIGELQLSARAAANGFDAHLLLFTGDILNHPSLEPAVQEYLRGYRARAGAFFVSGDVDGIRDLRGFLSGAGFELLDAESRVVELGGARLGILGLGLMDYQDRLLLGELVKRTAAAQARILMSHRPDALFMAQNFPIDLHLSGHTHGGQVALPFFGPVITMSRVSRAIAAGGLHTAGALKVLVSRGLGWEGHVAPRVRTFCRPHLILVELVP